MYAGFTELLLSSIICFVVSQHSHGSGSLIMHTNNYCTLTTPMTMMHVGGVMGCASTLYKCCWLGQLKIAIALLC
jgi:hypothetical protein